MTVATASRCAVHPDAAAVDICSRCGAFLCDRCLRLAGTVPFCESCLAAWQAAKPSRAAWAAFLLSLGGMTLVLFPLAIAAIVLGRRELARVREGSSPYQSGAYASHAVLLGIIALVGATALLLTAVALRAAIATG